MSPPRRQVAIIGGGIAGVTAAWQLARSGTVDATLFEASPRLGGTIETHQRDGFTIECGPDGWVSEKPWARELANELGLAGELIESNDAGRVTYILSHGKLVAIPDGMRMMVPTDLSALHSSSLFSEEARQHYAAEPTRADELRTSAPEHDESVSAFVSRHFGHEVLTKIAAPLLSGIFGGDVGTLSVRAVMPTFVQMEREHGSLIKALQTRTGSPQHAIFTSLRSGVETLVQRMVEEIPANWVRLQTPVRNLRQSGFEWLVEGSDMIHRFDAVMLAAPAQVASRLLAPLLPQIPGLLVQESTSAVVAALAFKEEFALPKGFGFLVPAGEASALLACTFVDQKFPCRTPDRCRLLRAFFGGASAPHIANHTDDEIAALALRELASILGHLPAPAFTVVRRWPLSLPQYAVGHLERTRELDQLTRELPSLWLLGNAYRGVGLPDLIRDARAAAQNLLTR